MQKNINRPTPEELLKILGNRFTERTKDCLCPNSIFTIHTKTGVWVDIYNPERRQPSCFIAKGLTLAGWKDKDARYIAKTISEFPESYFEKFRDGEKL